MMSWASLNGSHTQSPWAVSWCAHLRAYSCAIEQPFKPPATLLEPQSNSSTLLERSERYLFIPAACCCFCSTGSLISTTGYIEPKHHASVLSWRLDGSWAFDHSHVSRCQDRMVLGPPCRICKLCPTHLSSFCSCESAFYAPIYSLGAIAAREQSINYESQHDHHTKGTPPKERKLDDHGHGCQELALLFGRLLVCRRQVKAKAYDQRNACCPLGCNANWLRHDAVLVV
mmetsp:Transcript_11561/g.26167  ORF Transcript_11561/g.26167 Transcript_11561/m.26167 type:complete len:229 (-) Transcript_11561:12-698(-)